MTLKFVHTSDWHLGQLFYNLSRDTEHRAFLDWLVLQLQNVQADALLIAGDIFDTGNPPASAQNIYYSFLSKIFRELPHLQVVVIGGNHDSAARLDAPAALLEHLRVVHVGGLPWETPERAVVPLYNKSGACEAWVLAVPFLRPSDFGRVADGTEPQSMQDATELIYRRVTDEARARRQPGQALIGMGHCFMAGGEISELSERKIQRGNQEVLSLDVFSDDLCYVALGHLHKAQCVGKRAHVRYSGSPLPLSFSERNYKHQVVLVEIEKGELRSLTEIPVPRSVELISVPVKHAPLEQVLTALAELAAKYPKSTAIPLSESNSSSWPYLEVRIELEKPEPNLRTHIEKALENAAVQLVRIETRTKPKPNDAANNSPAAAAAAGTRVLAEISPEDLFKRKYHQVYADPMPPELLTTFHELVSLVHAKEHTTAKPRMQ